VAALFRGGQSKGIAMLGTAARAAATSCFGTDLRESQQQATTLAAPLCPAHESQQDGPANWGRMRLPHSVVAKTQANTANRRLTGPSR